MTQVLINRATLEQIVGALESTDTLPYEDWMRTIGYPAIKAGYAALANAEPTGWQPIDTAPKNGSFYLAFGADGDMWTQNQPNGYYPGEWYFDENRAQWRGSTRPSKAASHWLPLPKEPK